MNHFQALMVEGEPVFSARITFFVVGNSLHQIKGYTLN